MKRGRKRGGKKSIKKVVQEDTEVEFVCTLHGEGADQHEVVQEQEGPELDPEQQNPEQRNDEQQQTEEQHNTNEPEGEVELSTNEEPEVGTNRKRKRGPTRMKDQAKDPNTRVHVLFQCHARSVW